MCFLDCADFKESLVDMQKQLEIGDENVYDAYL